MAIHIEKIVLREIAMPLVHYFETSFGRTTHRRIILVEVVSQSVSGWGEVTCGENPFYNEEWTDAAWLIVREYVGPKILRATFASASEVADRSAHLRGHYMARGGVEAAVWDLEARMNGVPLWEQIGGGWFKEIACGVSIGIQNTLTDLLKTIEKEVASGYQRIKIKIKPGWDVDVVREVRRTFPSIRLMADANSAYTLADADHLKRLDEFRLMMIEQPLAHDEIVDHAVLQNQLDTPICLDECIRTVHHAEQAIRLQACGILNIKLGRVGGFREALRIHDLAQAHSIPVWCGGMLESGVGRAHNIALSTLPNFVLPGDVSASLRYWARDIITPPIEVSPQGTITVSEASGFGYEVDRDYLHHVTVREETVA
ncbi:MAG TPA: o-succinylbenzoate synthase [Bryobacteraceae bacterium]|jgi:O-succinylbenzoate synthase|nr:o-succinylbenzoate synthase [Bryobacteraceae bacterium]